MPKEDAMTVPENADAFLTDALLGVITSYPDEDVRRARCERYAAQGEDEAKQPEEMSRKSAKWICRFLCLQQCFFIHPHPRFRFRE